MAVQEPSDALSATHNSTVFELMIETTSLADLLQEMWFQRHELVDVPHSGVGAFGHELVLHSGTVMRHVQLKTRRSSRRTAIFNISAQLLDQLAAYVVLIEWVMPGNSAGMQLTDRWFGTRPGQRLPDLGSKHARHTKGNAQGVKGVREGPRVVPRGKFVPLADIAELTDRPFRPVGS